MLNERSEIELIERSGLFNPIWYENEYPDVKLIGIPAIEHFLNVGARLLRDPSERFHTKYYLEQNPDVAKSGMNPLLHFIQYGQIEGRTRIDPKKIAKRVSTNSQATIVSGSPQRPDSSAKPILLISGEPTDRPGFIYRVERYAEAFRKIGETAVIIPRQDLSDHHETIKSAKILYIWRAEWRKDVETAIAIAKENHVPVVFDVDDLVIRPELATAQNLDEIQFQKMNAEDVQKHYTDMRHTMVACDISTASTHELAWHMRFCNENRPTFVIPNGYAADTYIESRIHARAKAASRDGLIRIGYASGNRTHQADFRLCAPAVAEVLRQNENCRLVLFRRDILVTADIGEFPELAGLENQIELRDFVAHHDLPAEMARFDINLVPLECGNPFCEAKSELKFFEAAIADVPTIASPTGPFRRAIRHGETGFLAESNKEWAAALHTLTCDERLRRQIGREAHRRALWPWGPMRRAEIARSFIDQMTPGRLASRTAHFEAAASAREIPPVPLAEHAIIAEFDKRRSSPVTVVIPLFNYEAYIEEALESVKAQTLANIDIVIVDDFSTDKSITKAKAWLEKNKDRFNRAVLIQHITNQGLGASRNTGFDVADSLYIMALDADNRLCPECCEKCLRKIEAEGAAFAYPVIQKFGEETDTMGYLSFLPARLIQGNSVDAMAMISKEAWVSVGGFWTSRMGWQDYDLWCRFVDSGLNGVQVDEILAEYRVHSSSMLRKCTDEVKNKQRLVAKMEANHPWLSLRDEHIGHHTPAFGDGTE